MDPRTPFELHFRPYHRRLLRPLRTARGEVDSRHGYIVKLIGPEGATGFGEALTLDGHDRYSFDLCHELLSSLGPVVYAEELHTCTLPPVAFAMTSALAMIQGQRPKQTSYACSALLPNGDQAVDRMQELSAAGYRTFKIKIGTADLEVELRQLDRLINALPTGVRLRLDANGALTLEQAERWLAALASYESVIEYLEQPLPVGREYEMEQLGAEAWTPIALDESIRGIRSLNANLNWRGIIALKPSLSGPLREVREWRSQFKGEVSYATALETNIGLWGMLLYAGATDRAIGMVPQNRFFDDGLSDGGTGPVLKPDLLLEQCETVWQRLRPVNVP